MDAINWQPYEGGWFSTNYTFDHDKNYVLSAVISTDVEFVFSKVIGFSVSPFLIANNKSTAVGVRLSAIIGKVRF